MGEPIDPTNPVVMLCAEGMKAEAEGRPAVARARFQAAWDRHGTPYEGAIAAHYLARHQDGAAATLEWNVRALECADAAPPEAVRDFYPSLHLNLTHSYEQTDDLQAARRHLELAERAAVALNDSAYVAMLRDGLARARIRVQIAGTSDSSQMTLDRNDRGPDHRSVPAAMPAKSQRPSDSGFPAGIPAPALRALQGAGYASLEQLAGVSENELLNLHGMGPKGVRLLREALADLDLRLLGDPPR